MAADLLQDLKALADSLGQIMDARFTLDDRVLPADCLLVLANARRALLSAAPAPEPVGDVSDTTATLVRLLTQRDAAGRAKYGTTLDRADLSLAEWLQHMTEELLDGAGYAQAALRALYAAPLPGGEGRDSEDAKTEQALQRAAKELPEGWQVIVTVERGAGWVDLLRDGDHHTEYDVGDLAEHITEAIDAALSATP